MGSNDGYRSGLNRSMVRHLHGKVDRILSKFEYLGVLVVDIGSNDGTTLAAYPDRYRRLGIDLMASGFLELDELGQFSGRHRLLQHRCAGSWAVGETKVSVITSFSMFYDLEDPIQFMPQVVDRSG